MTDFTRINQPRVEMIGDILAMIRRSAHSQKISDEDVAELLAPVAALVCGPTTTKAHTTVVSCYVDKAGPGPAKPAPALPMAETPHYHRIGAFVDNLPAEHLENYITSITGRLCDLAAIAKAAA